MEDSIFIIFLAFGSIWILMAAAAWIALLKSDGQEIQFGKWGLIVILPIIIPLVFALVFGVVYH